MKSSLSLLLPLLLAGCEQDLRHQARVDPLEESDFFADGMGSRPKVPGTIARGHLETDRHLHRGRIGDRLADTFPFEITDVDLRRGRERFTIFCTPCHDYAGSGRGMIVQRGLNGPANFHTDRLREAPVGHYFDVITNGFGAMFPYGESIPADDRWRIIAYIRALQLSRNAPVELLEPKDLEGLR